MMVLRVGSRGAEVSLLQLGLRRAGYDNGLLDGIFGNETQQATAAFQRAEGIAVDGIAGEETWSRLAPWLGGYRVVHIQSGDTFYSLAQKYKSSIAAIKTANPTLEERNLPVGGEMVIPLGFAVVPTDIPVSPSLVAAEVAGLAARYPFIRSESYGKSVLERPLWTLSVGKGTRKVHFGAAIHANEWITSPLVMHFLEEYARALAADDEINGIKARELYQETTLYVTPLENPDGADLVTGAFPPGEALQLTKRIAAAYPSIPYPAGWKANARGVDLNLQFPAGWEEARRIKFAQGFRTPAPRDYVGRAPLSAPEAEALAAWTEQNGFQAVIAFHTQGGVIYWQYGDVEPEGARELGERLSAASGYPLEDTPAASANAGYKDWFILRFEKPGYTVEAGNGTNPLPLSSFDSIYDRVKPLMVEALRSAT